MHNIKVVEFQGLAPSVFCGLYFADQGANVTLVSRQDSSSVSLPLHRNLMNRNKHSIVIDLKNQSSYAFLKEILKDTDIVIDPYRPGVLQKLRLGPADLSKINPKIILLRVSGYGQNGPMSLKPGHDLNYLAVSGILPLLNQKIQNKKDQVYQFPMNYFADFVSASLGITGTLAALKERERSGRGSVVDCSLTDGSRYFANIILEDELKHPQQQKMSSLNIGKQQYIYTYKESKPFNQQQIENLIKSKEIKDFYENRQTGLQISRVKTLDSFDIQSFVNPFDKTARNLNQSFLRNKGQDTEAYKSQYAKSLKAKL